MVKIDDFLKANGVSSQAMAEALGVTREMVRRYRLGLAKPKPEIMLKIKQLTSGQVAEGDFDGSP